MVRFKLYREGADGEEFFFYYTEAAHACALSMICAARNELSEVYRALAIPPRHMDGLMRDYRKLVRLCD